MTGINLSARLPARYSVDFSGGKYFVLDLSGKIVWGPGSGDLAHRKCDDLQQAHENRAKIGERPCMCCGSVFHSEGIHNRLCNLCRRSSDPLSATGFAGGGDGRKPRKAAKV